MKSKIWLTIILKDDSEYEMAERMLKSFDPVYSKLIVGLTGTSGQFDKLKRLIKKHKGEYFITTPTTHPKIYALDNGKPRFANFAEARNACNEYAMSLIEKGEKCDWFMWADVDDILLGAEQMPFVADTALEKDMDMVFFTYWYSVRRDKDGSFDENSIDIFHERERLVRPGKFEWKSRLHEIQVPKENYKPKFTDWPYDSKKKQNIVWVHLPEKEDNKPERNLFILKLQVEDEQWKDPRTVLYMARSLYDFQDDQHRKEAIPLLEKYLETSGWQEERAQAWEYLAKIYSEMGNHLKAIECMFGAIQEFPNRHLNFLYLAKEYFEIGRFDYCNFWVDVALRMDKPQVRTVLGNPIEIMFMAAGLKANLAIKSMHLDDAIYWIKTRNELGKIEDDGMLKKLEDAKYFNQIGLAIFNLAKYLKDAGLQVKAKQLLDIIPTEYGREPFVYQIANELIDPRIWPDKSIVYYAGPGFENWSPKNLQKGIGGSETAIIELAKRWQAAGYDVTVFGDPGDDEGIYDGVKNRPHWEINWHDTFNTIIFWRNPLILDKDIKAKHIFVDLHDVASNLDWPKHRCDKVEKVFFKSKYQRKMIPNLPDDKCVIISNGIQT